MNNPKFSIIMPTYRRAHAIYQTVETIKAQTHKNWELIILDNDGDAPFFKDNFLYWFSDSRIRMFTDSRETGACYARNQAIPHATGDLLVHFDDDDLAYPNYLETYARAFAEHPKAKMVHVGMILANGEANYSYGTAMVCLRREYATPTWVGDRYDADQEYYKAIAKANGWTQRNGAIVSLKDITCRATTDPRGGMREGKY